MMAESINALLVDCISYKTVVDYKILIWIIQLWSVVNGIDSDPGGKAIGANHLLREFRKHELIQPRIYHGDRLLMTTNSDQEGGHTRAITLMFNAFDHDFILDLRLNRNLFGAAYVEKVVKGLEERGRRGRRGKRSVNHTETHCYYHGLLRGHILSSSSSAAAISTCHGIRGQISVEDETYFIEPVYSKDTSLSSLHYIMRRSDQIDRNLTCGQNARPRTKRQSSRSQVDRSNGYVFNPTGLSEPRDANDSTKYVELYVVNDFYQYKALNRRLDDVIRRTKDIINVVSSIYRPLNIYIILVGIEVWTEGNLIEGNINSDDTMNKFLEYRRRHISPNHRNDNAQLISGEALGGGVVGKAPIMTMCTYKTSGGVNSDLHTSLGAISTTVAHEMGHNFGLFHDLDSCECADSRCVMSSGGGPGNPTKWSSCSQQQLSDTFHQGMDYCLKNLPEMTNSGASCGNGFTEDGEDCDCGLEQDCKNPCCNAAICRFAPNATCATGHCCDLSTCQPMSSATVCRPSVGSCDLPEFCNGRSERCPYNIYRRDGTDCYTGGVNSYCYRGLCRTHDSQCKMLWGRTGKMSHRMCYERFNIMGTDVGHCGFNWINQSFQKCEQRDVFCGMLHCEHRSEKLMFWKEALLYMMPESYLNVDGARRECKAVIPDVGLDMPDPGMTFDGVKCGENQMCSSRRCVSIETLNFKQCGDCNGHGVCNSLGQCHCDNGYAPPYCDRRGLGGSEHSGPAQTQPPSDVGLIVGLCFLFLFLIPVIAILIILGYRHFDKVQRFIIRPLHKRYASFFLKKRFQKDTKDIEMSPPGVTVVTRPTSMPPRSPNIRRAVSFRPEDISNPLLQSSTNSKLTHSPSGGKAPTSLTYANSCRAAIMSEPSSSAEKDRQPVPQNNDRFAATSSQSIASQGSDLSCSSSGATDSHYLLPKKRNGEEVLQPSRAAPAPPYACPKKKKVPTATLR